jgi:hypothetical protein
VETKISIENLGKFNIKLAYINDVLFQTLVGHFVDNLEWGIRNIFLQSVYIETASSTSAINLAFAIGATTATRCQGYKTFYAYKLQLFIIS